MKVKSYRRIGDPNPIVQDAACVVVEGEEGQPLFVACRGDRGAVYLAHANDPDFNQMLRALGIDRLVFVEQIPNPLQNPNPAGLKPANPALPNFGL